MPPVARAAAGAAAAGGESEPWQAFTAATRGWRRYWTTNGVTDTAGDILAKAAWNYNLITNDISLGVHNPGFSTDVLQASIKALSLI